MHTHWLANAFSALPLLSHVINVKRLGKYFISPRVDHVINTNNLPLAKDHVL